MTVLYGIRPVLEALRAAGSRVERIAIERGRRSSMLDEIVRLARLRNVPVDFEEKIGLDRKSGGGRHQGVLCRLSEVELLEVEQVLESASSPGLVLVLDGIEDPQNLGAILRSAEVAGADGVILPSRRSAGVSAAVMRVSAGAAAHVRIARCVNLRRALESLKEKGYWVVGLRGEAARPLWEVDLTAPTALVLGSEGTGLRRRVMESCDFLASIPMRGKVGSYNASVAAGIALYECLRQRLRQSFR